MQFKLGNRRGSIAALAAVSMLAVLAVLSMVMDGGLLQDKRRSVQAAADAAAMAAASDLWEKYATNSGTDPGGTARTSALRTAAANGYNNDGVTNTVTVNIAPLAGNFVGVNGYAEVIIRLNQARGFSTIWGQTTLPVTAKAVAGGKPGDVGILMLNRTNLRMSGQVGGAVNIVNGGQVYINSTNAGAFIVESGGNLTTGGINITGGLVNDGTITYTGGGALRTGLPQMSDPLSGVPEPVPGGVNYGNPKYTGTVVMQPGIYGDITIGDKKNTKTDVSMAAGIYYVNGGSITMHANTTLVGSGVMFYDMPNNFFNVPAGVSVNISPPTVGPYRGISVFEPRAMSNEIHIITDGSITMPGALYSQAGEFDLRPRLATTVYNFGAYICDQAEWIPPGGGLGTVNLNPSTSAPTKRPLLVQ